MSDELPVTVSKFVLDQMMGNEYKRGNNYTVKYSKHHCVDCGRKIQKGSKRCRECFNKYSATHPSKKQLAWRNRSQKK